MQQLLINKPRQKYTLRSYQTQASEAGLSFFSDNLRKKNSFMVLPTGAGKSLIIADIASKLEDPTLVLQPTKELLEQNFDKYLSYGNPASIYSASKNSKEISKVTFATIGSIYKKPKLFEKFKNIIIDECHLVSPKKDSMYQKFFDSLKIKLLGLTATPFRLKSYNFPEPHSKLCFLNRQIPKIFQDLIFITQIQEMTEQGFWSPLEYKSIEFDKSQLVLNSTGADYTEKSINLSFNEQNILDQVVLEALKLKSQGKKQVLIFVPSIKEANKIALQLGVNCVSSKTDKYDRALYLDNFNQEKTWAIVNVNVLSVGYDNPKIDGIIDTVPTLSLARYYQKLGRGVRISPSKESCTIIDLAGNYELFGKIEDLEIKQVNNLWAMFSKGKLLTNTELYRKGEEPLKLDSEFVMPFGKFKGEPINKVPRYYLKWIFENVDQNSCNLELFNQLNKIFA